MSSDLLQNEVHIWYCMPEKIQDKEKLLAYSAVLSSTEIERLNRFHFEKDQHSYLVSHALLRHALSKYSTIDPSQWDFFYNSHGKPDLKINADNKSFDPEIKFNLTHTKGLCACVLTINRLCGIDAEYIYRKNNLAGVARRMFANKELEVIQKSGNEKLFYDFWTLREAYVKALGTGLTGSSKDFYFCLNTDISNEEKIQKASLHFVNSEQGSNQWQFNLFSPKKDYRLSIAVETSKQLPVKIAEFIP